MFQNENTDVSAEMEVALDDALSENKSLREQVKNLKGILNDMFIHGNMPNSSKTRVISLASLYPLQPIARLA